MANVACIGAGTVGSAWSVVFARAGHDVAIYDQSAEEREGRARARARATLEVLWEAGALEDPVEAVLGRIRPSPSIEEAVERASYVQESVREDLTTKRDVCGRIAEAAPEDCIIASSTSAIKGSDFLGDIKEPGRALVAHPVNPPSLIPLVELSGSKWTRPDIVDQASRFLADAGMKPITVRKEIDGFILNRLQYTLVAEALHLVGEGYCTASDIDRVVTDGLAMRWATIGPFQVAHLNASNGFRGFVEQLGPMMRAMGASAQTDYDWDDAQIAAIHAELEADTPVADIPERQKRRDRGILGVQRLKTDNAE